MKRARPDSKAHTASSLRILAATRKHKIRHARTPARAFWKASQARAATAHPGDLPAGARRQPGF
ncbi:hypothetical protein [Rhodoferax antarcticus]|uniref:hypothetical protein n=1 Tax=Rhodoferax antarcticus TaxID=81479 RepID=UPI002223EE61|nr:hypothetical protein [Rhodoferax antarcticus]MCW2313996.1 hypothetical protein [Rhodoferax antarcticus]